MNALWTLGTRHAIAYVENRDLALTLIRSGMAMGRTLNEAMAVYYSERGRAFAWQLLVPRDQIQAVATALGEGAAPPAQAELQPEEPATPQPKRAPRAKASSRAKAANAEPAPAPTPVTKTACKSAPTRGTKRRGEETVHASETVEPKAPRRTRNAVEKAKPEPGAPAPRTRKPRASTAA